MAGPAALVTIDFALDGRPTHRIAVARDSATDAPEAADTTPHSFAWTGTHDGGPMSTGPSTGHYANLVLALAEAKDQCEGYLKPIVQARKQGAAAAATSAAKRPKLAPEGEEE